MNRTREMSFLFMAGAVAAAVSVLVTVRPQYGLPVVAAVLGLLLVVLKRQWIIPLTLILSCMALPVAVPVSVGVAGFSFPLYEILLAIATAMAVHRGLDRYSAHRVLWFGIWIVIGLSSAFLVSAPSAQVLGDMRNPLRMAMALIVAAVFITDADVVQRTTRVLKWILWISAVLTVVASFTGIELAGRLSDASLVGESSDATRYLTAANFPALATFCVCAGLVVMGRAPIKSTLMWSAPALVVLLLAFSRNHILGLAVTLIVAFIAARSFRVVSQGIVRIGLVCAALALVTVGATSWLAEGVPGVEWFGLQAQSYSDRVVGGISSDVLNKDPSTLYRERESAAMEEAIEQAPLIGHGFGHAYKSPEGTPGTFFFDRGPYYGHNFYLWALVKTGFLGLACFLLAITPPLFRAIARPHDSVAVALASGAFGLLAISFVAPMPSGSPTAVVLGGLVGAVGGLVTQKQSASEPKTLAAANP